MAHETVGAAVLLLIILMPVYVTLGAWLFADERDLRTAFIGIGYMGVIAVAMIAATAALGVGFWIIANLPL